MTIFHVDDEFFDKAINFKFRFREKGGGQGSAEVGQERVAIGCDGEERLVGVEVGVVGGVEIEAEEFGAQGYRKLVGE